MNTDNQSNVCPYCKGEGFKYGIHKTYRCPVCNKQDGRPLDELSTGCKSEPVKIGRDIDAPTKTTPASSLDGILTKLENAVATDIAYRSSRSKSGRSPKSIHFEAKQQIEALITEELDKAIEKTRQVVLRATQIPKDARNPTRDAVVMLGEKIADHIAELKGKTNDL